MKAPSNPVASFDIKYRDGKGAVSQRVIDIPDFAAVSAVWITAYCRLRKSYRSFYPDRILSCVDANSGEVVSDVMGFLLALRDGTDTPAPGLAMADYIKELRSFIRGITADGVLHDVELRALRNLFNDCPADRPASVNHVLDVLEQAQDDGIITAEEHKQIMNAVQRI